MDLDKVVKLIGLMESHGLDEVEVEEEGVHIRLRKGGAPVIAPAAVLPAVPAVPVAAPAAPATATKPADKKDTVEITSPMVGTFYRAASPDADSFVNPGDHVTPDTVVCIIEAMKVMNEIKAEIEGEVVSVLVENGESVEYGQPLLAVRPTTPAK